MGCGSHHSLETVVVLLLRAELPSYHKVMHAVRMVSNVQQERMVSEDVRVQAKLLESQVSRFHDSVL